MRSFWVRVAPATACPSYDCLDRMEAKAREIIEVVEKGEVSPPVTRGAGKRTARSKRTRSASSDEILAAVPGFLPPML